MVEKEIQVIKRDYSGQEVWRYPGTIKKRSGKGFLISAIFNVEHKTYKFKKGDLFLELYPFGKWYNLYEIHDCDDGEIKCWYCNICRPVQLFNDQLSYDDLALDLMVYPDGTQLVLDEDEFKELPLHKNEKTQALKGLYELRDLFASSKQLKLHDLI